MIARDTPRKTRRKALQMMAKADGMPKDEKGASQLRMADLFKKTGGYRKSVRAGQDAGGDRTLRTNQAYGRQAGRGGGVEDAVRVKTHGDRRKVQVEREDRKFDAELLREARNRKRKKTRG